MAEAKDVERLTRGRARADILRTNAVASIRSVHELALRVSSEPKVAPQFLVAVTDLDMLWSQFKLEDESVLDFLIKLDKTSEYSSGLPAEVRALITESKAIADSLIPKGADAVDMSYINSNFTSRNVPTPLAPPTVINNSNSRLPEIPLPKFDGDFKYWPTFRDRFKALVDSRSNLTPIDKMYYLIGCLRGSAAEAVRSIPVASDSYDLAWTTLSNRFNRPRMVATSLVDKLLNVPSSTQESLLELTSFLCEFSESVSLLNALNIPDLSSFLLFALAFRRLPISTRKLFESTVTSDYPSMSELLTFVESRVSILELVGDSSSRTNKGTTASKPFYGDQLRKVGDRHKGQQSSHVTSFVTAASNKICPCCSEPHLLESCPRFKSWTVDDRTRWTREKKLCFMCFSAGHWSNQCKSKNRCHLCNRRHHHLVHIQPIEQRNRDEAPRSDTSLCASAALHQSNASSVVLGTALVHVRDRAGEWQTMRALIDSASQISAVTTACVDRLKLKCTRWTSPVTGLGGVPVINVQGRVEFSVQPRFAVEPVLAVHAWVLPLIL
uniref:Peptidase A2 domain-containing protein n=1 Tax=Schizaphis graminum TaxID=13262 RepID=A0A2S2PHQ7_SCHGA